MKENERESEGSIRGWPLKFFRIAVSRPTPTCRHWFASLRRPLHERYVAIISSLYSPSGRVCFRYFWTTSRSEFRLLTSCWNAKNRQKGHFLTICESSSPVCSCRWNRAPPSSRLAVWRRAPSPSLFVVRRSDPVYVRLSIWPVFVQRHSNVPHSDLRLWHFCSPLGRTACETDLAAWHAGSCRSRFCLSPESCWPDAMRPHLFDSSVHPVGRWPIAAWAVVARSEALDCGSFAGCTLSVDSSPRNRRNSAPRCRWSSRRSVSATRPRKADAAARRPSVYPSRVSRD